MNVVGKVGSLITQGVYSVATPFHPFGGAVDVIVVRQQDGSFRSTPWYVRFGKFQGVLKGAEKIVRINVNGVEANFHMYLDNSGEAYFVREVTDDKNVEFNGVVIDTNNSEAAEVVGSEQGVNDDGSFAETCRLEHSVSDSGVIQLQVDSDSSATSRIERASSDTVRIERQESTRFYEFEDEQTFLEEPLELSEYDSNQYEKLDGEVIESKGSDSEVVLMSVDGHVLTAPISASNRDTEYVQLSTPQFHLGPGRGTEFCEDHGEFSSNENAWTADYFNELNAGNKDKASLHELEVCEGAEEHGCKLQDDQPQEIVRIENEEQSFGVADSEGASTMIRKKDVFRSCLELEELPNNAQRSDLQDESSSKELHNSQEESSVDSQMVGESQHENVTRLTMSHELSISYVFCSPKGNIRPESPTAVQEVSESNLEEGHMASVADSEFKIDMCVESSAVEGVNSMQEAHASEDDCKGKLADESNEGHVDNPSSSFELSLCGHKLKAGVGLEAAVEAFDAHRISEEDERSVSQDKDTGISSSSSGRMWRLWPIPFRRVKTSEHTSSNSTNDEVFVDSESEVLNGPSEPTAEPISNQPSLCKQYIRTNVPTNEQIASLHLKEGQNLVTFSFSTRVLGTQQVDAHIYLWKWNAKIVISDVDGTITKSDVLGQFMPLVGKDWTQSGVATLFSAIKENGYQLLFLSARAIVQAYLTRSFLLNLKQDGKTLPNGPVVISPDGLFPSLFREVIRRAPHEFKIACLEDIRKLFPPDYNPFYAGFGNRDTDELSYRKIGIPKGKIFIINPKGEVAISQRIDRAKSYTSLHTLVNDMFPPTSLVEHEEYNSWNYWKLPLPDID